MSRPVQIVDYDHGWAVVFAELGATLRSALGGVAVRIDHIGSTAVPGLAADTWAQAMPEDFNVAVGYSLYADGEGIRAVAVTSRCVACGRLGYWVDWMVRTGDMDLLNLA